MRERGLQPNFLSPSTKPNATALFSPASNAELKPNPMLRNASPELAVEAENLPSKETEQERYLPRGGDGSSDTKVKKGSESFEAEEDGQEQGDRGGTEAGAGPSPSDSVGIRLPLGVRREETGTGPCTGSFRIARSVTVDGVRVKLNTSCSTKRMTDEIVS